MPVAAWRSKGGRCGTVRGFPLLLARRRYGPHRGLPDGRGAGRQSGRLRRRGPSACPRLDGGTEPGLALGFRCRSGSGDRCRGGRVGWFGFAPPSGLMKARKRFLEPHIAPEQPRKALLASNSRRARLRAVGKGGRHGVHKPGRWGGWCGDGRLDPLMDRPANRCQQLVDGRLLGSLRLSDHAPRSFLRESPAPIPAWRIFSWAANGGSARTHVSSRRRLSSTAGRVCRGSGSQGQ